MKLGHLAVLRSGSPEAASPTRETGGELKRVYRKYSAEDVKKTCGSEPAYVFLRSDKQWHLGTETASPLLLTLVQGGKRR